MLTHAPLEVFVALNGDSGDVYIYMLFSVSAYPLGKWW